MTKICGVSGSQGFIGRYLVSSLLELGYEVRGLDNFATSSNTGSIKEENYFFTEGDVSDPLLVRDCFSDCDEIFHLAAAVGVKNINENPTLGIKINVGGTENILEVAENCGAKLFIASSSEVYGKGQRVPFTEGDDLIIGDTSIPRWSYALAKALDEHLAIDSYRTKSTKIVVGRFFNTVGRGQIGDYGMVIPRFVKSALDGEDLVIHGNGLQTRCFGHVSEVIHSVLKLMATPAAYGEVVNIGSPFEISIKDLAEEVIKITGSNSKIRKISYADAYGENFEDLNRRVPSVEKLEQLVGIRFKKRVDEIILDVVEDFK